MSELPHSFAVTASNLEVVLNPGQMRLVNNVSVSFQPGEYVALVGNNGSGKSVMAGLLAAKGFRDQPPNGGQLLYGGLDVYSLTPRERAELRSRDVGIVIQNSQHGLLPNQTVASNLRFGANFRGATIDEDALTDVVAFYGLGKYMNQLVKPLSGGLQRLVAIAKAEATNPSLLVMDEPAAALDPGNADIIYNRLGMLTRERGKTVIIVSHERGAHIPAPRVITISQGSITSDISVAKV